MGRAGSSTATSGAYRHRTFTVGLAILAMVAAFVAASPVASAACAGPEVRVVASQGASDYDELAWGRSTMVVAHLASPACRAVVGATGLEVAVNGTHVTTLDPMMPVDGNEIPTEFVAYNPADPVWFVPGDVLAPAEGATSESTASFTAVVDWDGGRAGAGTATASSAVTLARRSASLRSLIVPLGDSRQDRAFIFTPDGDRPASMDAFETVWRTLPAEDGVTGLGDVGDAGLRRTILDPGNLDVGPGTVYTPGLGLIDDAEPGAHYFCSRTDEQFLTVQSGLIRVLFAHNSVNPGAVADHVMGVAGRNVWNPDCPNIGRAALPGVAGWARLQPGRTTERSAGAVAAMETLHNLGLVQGDDPRHDETYDLHSKNPTVVPRDSFGNILRDDGGLPLVEAFDPHGARYVSDDAAAVAQRSPSGYAARNDNTFAEAEDWVFTQCMLAVDPMTAGSCPLPASVGKTAAQDLRYFKLVGTSDGTQEGSAFNSHWTPGGNPTTEPADSDYTLVFRRADESIAGSYRLPASQAHAHAGQTGGGHGDGSVIEAEYPFPDGVSIAEVWYAGVDTGTRVYRAADFANLTIDSIEHGPSSWSFDPAWDDPAVGEVDPAFSSDGALVAFAEGCDLVVGETTDPATTARTTDTTGGCSVASPTIHPDGDDVLFICGADGDLCRADLGDGPMLGDVDRVYQCERNVIGACIDGTQTTLLGGLTSVAYAPNGDAIVSDGDDLYRVEFSELLGLLSVARTQQLTDTPEAEDEPSVSPDGDEVAFTQDGASVRVLDLATLATRDLAASGSNPSWGGSWIAFEDAGNIYRVHQAGSAVSTLVGEGTDPAFRGGTGVTVAVERTVDGQEDIYLGSSGDRIDIVVRGTADDVGALSGWAYNEQNTDQQLRMAIGVDLPVFATDDEGGWEFRVEHYEPAKGRLFVGVSNGIRFVTGYGDEEPYDAGPLPGPAGEPVLVFTQPGRPDDHYGEREVVPLHMSAWDPESGEIDGADTQVTLELPDGRIVEIEGGRYRRLTPQDVLGLDAWPRGTYTLTATYTDGDGLTGTDVVTFIVDGIEVASIDAEPNTLQLDTSGTPVTTYVTLPDGADPSTVTAAAITEIDGELLADPIPAFHLDLDPKSGVLTAQFGRQAVEDAVRTRIPDGTIAVLTVEGYGDGFRFRGADLHEPVVQH